jgi:hypothetical protein
MPCVSSNLRLVAAAITLLALTALNLAATPSKKSGPDIFLCIDSLKSARPGQGFLVYSYINGEKTACMPKHELLELLAKPQNPLRSDSVVAAHAAATEIKQKMRIVDSCKALYQSSREYRGANLRMRDMKGAKLYGADMSGADLESADLRDADLRYADLSGANLTAAYLKGADLRSANLSGARLAGAYLNAADLRGIRNLDIDAVKAVRTLYEAEIDTAVREEIEFCCPDKLRQASWYWHDNQWADERGKRRRSRLLKPTP